MARRNTFILKLFFLCRATWAEGAQACGGAAEQRHQVLEGGWDGGRGARWRQPLVQPPVAAAGETSRTPHSVHPRPAEDLLPQAGGPGAAAGGHR